MQTAKRWLYLVHRWLGVVLCAFFAMWFVSGVVMMYVGYPKLTDAERLAHLPALDPAAAYLAPHQALAAAGVAGPLKDLRLLASRGGEPVYLAVPVFARVNEVKAAKGGSQPARGEGTVVIDARSGIVLKSVGSAEALATAAVYAGAGTVAMRYEGTITEDAFTHSRGLDAHRPLHRVQLGDEAHTLLYISGTTGEVVRDAPRAERWWNYAGSWIHWLYPFRGGVFDRWWTDIVDWLSVAGIVLTITGTVVGVLRWRFKRPYKSGARTPYQGFMMRWHHITGLCFAVVTLTWIFSGLMSMNPWKVLESGAPPLRTEAMDGGRLTVSAEAASVPALLVGTGRPVHELRWTVFAGHKLVLASGAMGRPAVLDAGTALPYAVNVAELTTAARKLVAAPVERIDTLAAYDLYYYSRAPHTMSGGTEKPLPALRMVFQDTDRTWVHLDPLTGAVIGRTDDRRRMSRWLFAMLHSWDWLPLLERRPLWDLVLIVLSIGGAAMSLTGVVIGWRRLGKKLRSA